MRITDTKAVTIRDGITQTCPICEKQVIDSIRVSIAWLNEDLYVHPINCYPKLRRFCEVDDFAKIFGA